MPRHPQTEASPILPLPIGHHRFINAYEALGFAPDRAIDAYQQVYQCKRPSAGVGASRLLSDVRVREEIARRIEATRVVTREALGACLLKYRRWAEEQSDYQAAAAIIMDQAKLAGFLVEKHQDVTPVEDTASLEARIRQRLHSPESLGVSSRMVPDAGAA